MYTMSLGHLGTYGCIDITTPAVSYQVFNESYKFKAM